MEPKSLAFPRLAIKQQTDYAPYASEQMPARRESVTYLQNEGLAEQLSCEVNGTSYVRWDFLKDKTIHWRGL